MLTTFWVGFALMAASEVLTTGPVELVADGFMFTEGPLYLKAGGLVFSDIPKNCIYRPDKSVFREPSDNANGLAIDPQGRIVACEHGSHSVTRMEKDGKITLLAAQFEGKNLNSPNDLVIRSDGTIYFTDPPYGLALRKQELPFQGVFAIAPDGKLTAIARDFNKPNGICLSPDEHTLYVSDTDGNSIRMFDVAADGSVSGGKKFCDVAGPDGVKVDGRGYLWCAADDGIRVITPKGELVQTVAVPQQPANCAFGDADGKTLYITARTGLFKVRCATPGLGFPASK